MSELKRGTLELPIHSQCPCVHQVPRIRFKSLVSNDHELDVTTHGTSKEIEKWLEVIRQDRAGI